MKTFARIFIFFGFAAVLALVAIGINRAGRFYNSVFRLSAEEVSAALAAAPAGCTDLAQCRLEPGDILVRRYITSRTWIFNSFMHPYFTHAAFYLGEDRIVEAVGREKDQADEIQVARFSKSDWVDGGAESFVIIRPRYEAGSLQAIQSSLEGIAADPDYRFGLPQDGPKLASCADLIFSRLQEHGIVAAAGGPAIITPDYLAALAAGDSSSFEIVGYRLATPEAR